MTELRKYWLPLALGLALLAALLVLSSLNVARQSPAKKPIVLQNVQLYIPQPPPPTPEPVKRSSRSGAAGAVQVQVPQRQVQLGLMQLDTRFVSEHGVSIAQGFGGSGTGVGGDGFGTGDQVLQLNELDSTPVVMSAPLFTYPEQFRRKNIREFVVKFQIFVDEEGHTFPVRVVESPDPALNAQFLDYAARVVFTPPVQVGKKVKAQYLWPVKFTDTDLNRRPNGFR